MSLHDLQVGSHRHPALFPELVFDPLDPVPFIALRFSLTDHSQQPVLFPVGGTSIDITCAVDVSFQSARARATWSDSASVGIGNGVCSRIRNWSSGPEVASVGQKCGGLIVVTETTCNCKTRFCCIEVSKQRLNRSTVAECLSTGSGEPPGAPGSSGTSHFTSLKF